jgi:hypothetical protein
MTRFAPRLYARLKQMMRRGRRRLLRLKQPQRLIMHGKQRERSPIIVYGAPRSGTTYLARLLNQHPDVFVSDETRLFAWAHESLRVLPDNEQFVLNKRDRFVEHLLATYPDLIRDFYRKLAPDARYWGDKNPHYADPMHDGCLDTILELFPTARFIHIVRDGRDVATSIIRNGWVDFDVAHRVWVNFVRIGCDFGEKQPSGQYFEIRYEDLVRDDVLAARQLFDSLNIDMHPQVIEFCREQTKRRTPLSNPTRNLGRDASASEWADLLAPDQRQRSLDILAECLVRLGYETESSLARERRALAHLARSLPADPLRLAVQPVPQDATVLVVSGGEDRLLFAMNGRRAWHFPRRPGGYNIHAPDVEGSAAVALLERLREEGAHFLVVPWAELTWVDRNADLRRHLDEAYRRIPSNEGCLIYDLTEGSGARVEPPESRRGDEAPADPLSPLASTPSER